MSGTSIDEQDVVIGVTGHRSFDVDDTSQRVDHLLDAIVGGRRPLVVSSLAEGADRLVAQRVLARPHGHLAAILPLVVEDYERDFATAASIAEFRALLAAAGSVDVVELPAGATREEAYERAGHEVVARCDVLIAVWDGAAARGRGGTADIVEHARQLGRRVEQIIVTRDAA